MNWFWKKKYDLSTYCSTYENYEPILNETRYFYSDHDATYPNEYSNTNLWNTRNETSFFVVPVKTDWILIHLTLHGKLHSKPWLNMFLALSQNESHLLEK